MYFPLHNACAQMIAEGPECTSVYAISLAPRDRARQLTGSVRSGPSRSMPSRPPGSTSSARRPCHSSPAAAASCSATSTAAAAPSTRKPAMCSGRAVWYWSAASAAVAHPARRAPGTRPVGRFCRRHLVGVPRRGASDPVADGMPRGRHRELAVPPDPSTDGRGRPHARSWRWLRHGCRRKGEVRSSTSSPARRVRRCRPARRSCLRA